MKSRIVVALAALAGIFGTFSSRSALAAVHQLHSSMSGAQENPPTGSAATGTCDITADDVTNVVTASCSYSGLSAAATVGHIHAPAGFGANAGVVLPFTITPATSGTATGTGTLAAATVAAIIGGQAYTNIHTSTNPSGEIRGQIGDFAVSAPTALAYVINGASNPTLTLTRGKTYLFQVDASGHPFFISTTANSPTGPHFLTGVTGDNVMLGTLTFTVPASAPATLFYQCGIHPQMSGTLNIVSPPVPATGPLAAAGLGALLLVAGVIALRRRFFRAA
jgi:hypothetical protein